MLKDARLQANLTQTQLAQKLNVPQSFVSKYEHNKRKLDVLEFIKIVQILNQHPTKFIQKYWNKI